MKKILSVNDVRLSDTQTIQSGTPSKELMYRAALGVYNSYTWNGNIGIFCGSGNNAGDGYALVWKSFPLPSSASTWEPQRPSM